MNVWLHSHCNRWSYYNRSAGANIYSVTFNLCTILQIAIREKPKPFDTLYITTPDNEYESEQVRIMHRQRLTLKWKLKGLSPFEACIFLTSCIFHVRTSLVCKCSFPSNLKKNYHLFLLKSIFETWAGFIFSNQQYRCGSSNANDAKNISHVEQIHFL